MAIINSLVSLVIVLREQEIDLANTLKALESYLNTHFTDFEILLVDHNSNKHTLTQVKALLERIQSVRYIRLMSPVEADVAHAAGMENAIGDYVILFSPQSDSIDCILQAVIKCQQGAEVVVGVSKQACTLGYLVARPFIQLMLRKIGYDLPRNATSFRCLTRKAVNSVIDTGRYQHQFYMRMSKIGCVSDTLVYKNVGTHKKTFFGGLLQTLNLLVFNSTTPLRWMSMIGALGSFVSLVFATYSILIRFFKDDVIEGWTSLAFVMSFMFTLLFTILAFIGEYLARLLDDRSDHRDYSISHEMNSCVMLNENRVNVVQK